jgi:isovaleryl-CoA dehydrogenase
MAISLAEDIQALKTTAESVVAKHVQPHAESVDRNCTWPSQAMQAFASSGLLGLQVPKNLGGHGQGLFALTMMTEIIGKACPSTAMCFGMHCVGTAVIVAKATRYHREGYLRKIGEGRHITSLALSESGSGAHLYLPQTVLTSEGINYIVNGTKQFITNGAHADSYVISTVSPSDQEGKPGIFSCLIVDRNGAGLEWLKPWNGFGMRGNSSRGLILRDVKLPKANLLGEEGDQNWYIFEVIAPFFLMAMSGTYLGIAQAAVEAVLEHLKTRQYASGSALNDYETLQVKVADMWVSLEKTRSLIYEAAHMGDSGQKEALHYLLGSKIAAAETAVNLANEAMTLCGGIAYRENSRVAQLLRDARAGHIMAPTTEMLRVWLGKSLLGLPLL